MRLDSRPQGVIIVVSFPPSWGGTNTKISPPTDFCSPPKFPPQLLGNQVPPQDLKSGGERYLVPPQTWRGTPIFSCSPPSLEGKSPISLQILAFPLQIWSPATLGGKLKKKFGGEHKNFPPNCWGFPPKVPPQHFEKPSICRGAPWWFPPYWGGPTTML